MHTQFLSRFVSMSATVSGPLSSTANQHHVTQIWMSTSNILIGNFYYFNSNDLQFDDVS